ncbi:SDR family oxidoreductase [Candidatus Sumerlaeota bacterium]|nr:SDR family oxidoreductase [Candidatus Sumerlaeota bacterium]
MSARPNETMRFENKVAVVTGAGYGIGEAIAMSLAREGASLVLAARSREKLESVASAIGEMGRRAEVVVTDVSDEVAVKKMIQRAVEVFGRIDILVNNAGIAGPTKPVTEIKGEEWRETLDVNLTGAFYCAKHAAHQMIEAGAGGAMVNIASVAGRIGYAMRTPYAASKWGMIGLSHSLAAELGPKGIRVNCVCPGPVDGERMEAVIAARAEATGVALEKVRDQSTRAIPLGRWVTPGEVARAVLFFASEEDSSGVTGQVFNVCGGARIQ